MTSLIFTGSNLYFLKALKFKVYILKKGLKLKVYIFKSVRIQSVHFQKYLNSNALKMATLNSILENKCFEF